MDKYEYNLKLEEIDKLVDQKDFEEAARLADTIDWKRVRNIRTLALVSEIYEKAGRLEDSKNLLVRAYKRSPVGRTILCRLVEVTTSLRQYDEALEYYKEYVQVAPNDNNRFILKYKIYRGRGASVEELIAILEEYLGMEFTERWAYELAKLYQQAGQIQKCLAACDDLVLWFQSGKYVVKALELKKKYAPLTPKQMEIYNAQYAPEPPREIPEEEQQGAQEDEMLTTMAGTDGEVIAETIIAETEKEIADEVTAHKAEMEQTEQQGALLSEDGSGKEEAFDDSELQHELAKSMREIMAGVVKRTVDEEEESQDEEDGEQEPVVPKKLEALPKMEEMKTESRTAGRLSIDDILLSMGEKGRMLAKSVSDAQANAGEGPEAGQALKEGSEAADGNVDEKEGPGAAQGGSEEAEADTAAGGAGQNRRAQAWKPKERTLTEAVESELTSAQREALQYSDDPERAILSRKSLPTYQEEPKELQKPDQPEDEKKLLAKKTIRVPTEKIASLHARYGVEELWQEHGRLVESEEEPEFEDFPYEEDEEPGEGREADGMQPEDEASAEESRAEGSQDGGPDQGSGRGREDSPAEEELHGSVETDGQETDGEQEPYEEEELPETDGGDETQEDGGQPREDYEEGPFIPDHLRELFAGFTEVEGLEPQIANAVMQAASNRGDRTSRTGNILIFGAHGSGKTTLAMNIAKAVAQDQGSETLKLAKIYAADFNRKDIPATIAKIAGGTLIIEEAGDLDSNAVDQLTTAMEFRTDGMLVILEDEQQYIHELLMQHPRFTMKFTAQIYIPDYTAEELGGFAQLYANGQDFVISEEGQEELYQRISAVAEQGGTVSLTDITELVNHAIHKSNKLFRRIRMGKKRYDESDYVILFAKDFK